jgi:hypothetical protein
MTIPELRLELESGVAERVFVDFNRLRYFNVPTKNNIKNSIFADRDEDVFRWHRCFKDSNEYSDRTLIGYIHDFTKFIRVCDQQKITPESKGAVILWERHLVEQVRLNGMNINSARKLISSIKSIFTLLNHETIHWFSQYSLFRSEINPTKGYSDKELSQLLKLLHPLFKQLCNKILSNPEYFISEKTRAITTTFEYKGNSIPIAGAITKCFCAGFFLLSYFTLSNTSTILKMVKVDKNAHDDDWFEQSVLKKRANKFVSISIGDNGTFNVPKYALTFFKNLLKLSKTISIDKHLLYQTSNGKILPLEVSHLRAFSNWLQMVFSFKNDAGAMLKPINRKFRTSGSYRYLMLTGSDIETSMLLGNTPQVLKRHYSDGNEGENNQQLTATALTLENSVKCSSIEEAKELTRGELNVEVLPFEAFLNKYSPTQGQKTPLGTACKNPYSEQLVKYQRKMNFSPKDFSVKNLACSDITNCFFCKNQVVIESVDDIWCLISFKLSLTDSKEYHLNENQFQKNFSELLTQIDLILYKINPSIRRNAEKKLNTLGRHPLWPED